MNVRKLKKGSAKIMLIALTAAPAVLSFTSTASAMTMGGWGMHNGFNRFGNDLFFRNDRDHDRDDRFFRNNRNNQNFFFRNDGDRDRDDFGRFNFGGHRW